MTPAACCLLCFCVTQLLYVTPPAAGKPLPPASPGLVFSLAGNDVVLPCLSTFDPSRVTTVEWSRLGGPAPLTVHVFRDGKELVKEKTKEYVDRTAILDHGSLKLLGVQRWDNATYRCVLRGSSVEEETLVSLIVAEVSDVEVTLHRTSTNELFVLCESSGWSPKPVIFLLDAARNNLTARTQSLVGPDERYAVKAEVGVAVAAGTRTFICRVMIPDSSLVMENKIHITDDFSPEGEESPKCWVVLFAVIVLVCVFITLAMFVVPLKKIEKLRTSVLRLTGLCVRMLSSGGSDHPLLRAEEFTEYGDVGRVETSGASEETMRFNRLMMSGRPLTGLEASQQLAARDLEKMKNYKEPIIRVGERLHVRPALIAAIISRQSQAGTRLRPDGFGDTDQNCFGLMQINKNYHAVKGEPFSWEHIDEGVTFLIQLIKTMQRTKPDWTREQQLKGALSCYIAGEDRVTPLMSPDEVDSVTPCRDFANDVVARAHWFSDNGF